MSIYEQPWKLIPNSVRACGGREIGRFRGEENPMDTMCGAEAWIGSVTKANGASAENPFLGCSEVVLPNGEIHYLCDLIRKQPELLLGLKHMERFGTNLGILVKMLDAKTPFLLQCHPTKMDAKKNWGSSYGKEECWYILGTRDDVEEPPYILLGFREDVSKEKFEYFYRQGNLSALESMCHKVPVRPGEAYFIPGGVPHALGAGCFVAEIQEPSDLTAVPISQEKLLEFRRTANPKGVFYAEDEDLYEQRMLHAFDYQGECIERILERYKSKFPVLRSEGKSSEFEIFGKKFTDSFFVTIVDVDGQIVREDIESAQIGLVLSGSGSIRCGECNMSVERGDELFFPYKSRNLSFCGKFKILLCSPGGRS